ncbi:hypothetical protein KXV92_006351 [Aspergillus fumigatus]|nr:hypothetical protein KXW88_002461 [Aspergillus fumigatus]KAH2363662.1 hypothetical protein KXV98_003688 [Aspergillus fumigatus]KAH3184987.1 hypothetical protein KXV92_006351 [Aspergillus fumigatus]KAJ8226369.1 hypothetical protein LV156_008950 [Aspergillus fumigatus]KAJ8228110.1 hypothetical protein LV160_008928 [Aspergillus fumigatus]
MKATRVSKSEDHDCVHHLFDIQRRRTQLQQAIKFFSGLRGATMPTTTGDCHPLQIHFEESFETAHVKAQIPTDTTKGFSGSDGVTMEAQSKLHTTVASASEQQPAELTTNGQTFVCSFSRYGCTSTFTSKNEWKRHIAYQHVQLGFFCCDVGSCGQRVNDKVFSTSTRNQHVQPAYQTKVFNRKDLFTQHQRRCHAPRPDATESKRQEFEAGLEDVCTRCWHEQRKPPEQSSCGFCGQSFCGPNSWNDRMDHVAQHFKDKTALEEAEDIGLRNWAISEGIIQRGREGQWVLTALCC